MLVLIISGIKKLVYAYGRPAEIFGDQGDRDSIRVGKNGTKVFRLGLYDANIILLVAQFVQEQLVLFVDLLMPDTFQFSGPHKDGKTIIPCFLYPPDIPTAFLSNFRALKQTDLLRHAQATADECAVPGALPRRPLHGGRFWPPSSSRSPRRNCTRTSGGTTFGRGYCIEAPDAGQYPLLLTNRLCLK